MTPSHIVNPNLSIGLLSNFSFLRSVSPDAHDCRLSDHRQSDRAAPGPLQRRRARRGEQGRVCRGVPRAEVRSFWGTVVLLALFALLTLPSGAALRNPETGSLIADSPFMNGLIVAIALLFLVAGVDLRHRRRIMKGTVDVVKAMEKAIAGLAGLIVLLFVISLEFLAYFTYSNLATLAAVKMGDALETAGLGALPLLIGFVITHHHSSSSLHTRSDHDGRNSEWAIFAPVFVPLLMRLNVAPEAVLAAYRVADSPMNAISPLKRTSL